jgi:protoporphyrinogen oxidase
VNLVPASKRIAVIAGAGPAGLTAALELLRRSDIQPIVFDCDTQVGGISKTINYRGNRMDLGGHRFFSKSDWVMRWWQQLLPVENDDSKDPIRIHYQRQAAQFVPSSVQPSSPDAVMLVRQRLSRIFYRRRFFDYPLKLNATTLTNMGLMETFLVGSSYLNAKALRQRPENSLEDFFINRFGDRLYRTFFKDYTEKVWGVPCTEISAEWGAQRIKGLSVTKALTHAFASQFRSRKDTAQKGTETSLIERFLYPKFGPGQMWEEAARLVAAGGGEIHLRHRVIGLERTDDKVTAVLVKDEANDTTRLVPCNFFLSTMPVRDLSAMLKPADDRVVRVSRHLPYRDFITAGLLVTKMNRIGGRAAANGMPPDNWIYIQEPDVRLGRLQIFNNWSPHMVADAGKIWLGLEYFCREGDDLWSMHDSRFVDFAAAELEKIGMIDRRDVLDGTVVRVPKAYPAYFGEYRDFGVVREFLCRFSNLYPIGRNGMHRYNNQDHSMLAADCAVGSILNGGAGKADIWAVNAEDSYHEEVTPADSVRHAAERL